MNGRDIHIKFNRRKLLAIAAVGTAGLIGYSYLNKQYEYVRSMINFKVKKDENSERGHLVREELNLADIFSREETETLIVGSGISGLSTAYFLEKKNHKNYRILEADRRIGGNSASDGNDLSQYPLGAHYLPIVRNDDPDLIGFLQEIGVINGFKEGLPLYNEEYLCQVPSERLFIKGRWQEGIIPLYAADKPQLYEMKAFLQFVESIRQQKGRDGKYLFSIPVDKSSQDTEWINLDKISFREYLDSKNWKSEYLNWYVNYCCRDDFGSDADQTSAWAGLHYFCSRNGRAANAESQSVLTWPQGNGFLVQQLQAKLSQKVQTESTVRRVIKKNDHYEVYYSDAKLRTILVKCKNLVYAVPKAVVKRIQPELNFEFKVDSFPWLVTNIRLKKNALEEKSDLSWDNVRFGAEALGYVNSGHQLLQQNADEVNITFYFPFSSASPTELRKELAKKSENELFEMVLQELVKMHPKIEAAISSIQVKIWGHGMVAPKPDYIWTQRKVINRQEPSDLYFAHTERAGISIFEEAFHQGLNAATSVMKVKKT